MPDNADQATTMTPELMDKKLAAFKEKNLEVSVFLSNGIRLNGAIIEFDAKTLVISSDTGPEGMTINRANISTVSRRTANSHPDKEGGHVNGNTGRRSHTPR